MDNKARTLLDKINQDKGKGNHSKALKKVHDGLSKYPDEIDFHIEGADVCLESGEPLKATQFLKTAFDKFPAGREQLDAFLREKIRLFGDPVLGKFLLEQAVRDRAFETALQGLEDLPSRAVRDLLARTRTKRQSLISPGSGEFASNGKIVANKMSESLLCLRLGRLKDAMRAVLQILEEKPVEAEQLEPFLDELSKQNPGDGRVRFAHAHALTLTQHYDKAMIQLVAAARADSELVADCLEFVRDVADKHKRLPETVDNALIELLLISGDLERAVGLLRERLDDDPGAATAVMELIANNIDATESSLELHFLYVDAALESKQNEAALEMIKTAATIEGRRTELYEWLVEKSKECFLPASVLLYEGELAILEGKHDKAIELFTAVCGNSASDVPDVLAVVERHMKADSRLRDFYEEHMGSGVEVKSSETSGSFDVQHFEVADFSFSQGESDLELEADTSAPTLDDVAANPEPGIDRFDGIISTNDEKSDHESRSVEPLDLSGDTASDDENESLPGVDNSDGIIWEEEDETVAARSIASTTGKISESPAPKSKSEPRESAPDFTEEYVNNLGEALYESGARTFFHVDEDEVQTPAEELDSEVTEVEYAIDEPLPPVETPEEVPQPADVADVVREEAEFFEQYNDVSEDDTEQEGPIEDMTFAGRLATFRAGSLDPDATVTLVEEAFESGRIEELRELLEFEPRNADEQLLRKRYQVECHIVDNYAVAALDILDTIDSSQLSDEETRFVGMKTAVCHRMMNEFEAAHEILLKLSERFPDDEDINKLARRNYEQFLRLQIDDSPALEKATFVASDISATPRSKS